MQKGIITTDIKFKSVVPTGKDFNLVGLLEDGTLVMLVYTGDDKKPYLLRDCPLQDFRGQ